MVKSYSRRIHGSKKNRRLQNQKPTKAGFDRLNDSIEELAYENEDLRNEIAQLRADFITKGRFAASDVAGYLPIFISLGTLLVFANSLLFLGLTLTENEISSAQKFLPFHNDTRPETLIDTAIFSAGLLQTFCYGIWIAITIWILYRTIAMGTLGSILIGFGIGIVSPSLLIALIVFSHFAAAAALAERSFQREYPGLIQYLQIVGREAQCENELNC